MTHSGFSAPAILKLSAYGAIELAKLNYKFKIQINFIKQNSASCLQFLGNQKLESVKKLVRKLKLPKSSGPRAFGTIPRVAKPKHVFMRLVVSLDKYRFSIESCFKIIDINWNYYLDMIED